MNAAGIQFSGGKQSQFGTWLFISDQVMMMMRMKQMSDLTRKVLSLLIVHFYSNRKRFPPTYIVFRSLAAVQYP